MAYIRHAPALAFPSASKISDHQITKGFTALHHAITQMETWNMPSNASKKSYTGGDVRFIDKHLTSDEKRIYTEWIRAEQHISSAALEQCAQRSWKLSCSYDVKNKVYIATHICWDEKSPNYRVGISSRAGDVYSAILINAFKLAVLYAFSTLSDTSTEADWG
jgi:hypothetical protein